MGAVAEYYCDKCGKSGPELTFYKCRDCKEKTCYDCANLAGTIIGFRAGEQAKSKAAGFLSIALGSLAKLCPNCYSANLILIRKPST